MSEDYIKRIWEILTTFTKEAQKAALIKCKELNFDINRGEVSLDESFVNMEAIRLTIMDAIEKRKLVQLPITVQKDIISSLESITKSLAGLANGADEIVNIVNAIEKLNIAIWQYGFHNLSDEVLGYQEKLNQLKMLDLEIKKLQDELKIGLDLKDKLENLVSEYNLAFETIQVKAVNAGESENKITKIIESMLGQNKISTETLTAIQQTEKAVKVSATEVDTSKERITNLSKGIEQMTGKSEETSNKISLQQTESNRLLQLIESMHKQIEGLLPGATSAGLASAFEGRKNEIAKSKKYWVIGFISSLLVLLVTVFWLHVGFKELGDKMEWWKYLLQRAPLLFPSIWLGWFFGRNHGHMVRLEEDYAFKESISRSFEGYKNQMKEVDPSNALPKLCDKTISILSETPLRIFDRKTSDETPANSMIDRLFTKGKQEVKQ